jgi:hypothetical protein
MFARAAMNLHWATGTFLAGAGTALASAGAALRDTGQHLHRRVA